MLLLVPRDPLRPHRPDEHFAPEAAAAKDTGHDVALIDHDALTEPGGASRAAARIPEASSTAVYRGWMLTSAQYAALAGAAAAKGVTLRTTPDQYRQAHELPGWHPPWHRSLRPPPGQPGTPSRTSTRRARASARARPCSATTSSR